MAMVKLEVMDEAKTEGVLSKENAVVFVNTDYIVKIDEVFDKSLHRHSRVFLVDGSVLLTNLQAAVIADKHNA